VEERLRIWKGVVPGDVDAADLDFAFLAQRFALAGGHIRSIVFHACLLSAAPGAPHRLTMPATIAAVKREYDKLDRVLSLEQYGQYAAIAEKMQ
jgi:vesicle-fusing ATPase